MTTNNKCFVKVTNQEIYAEIVELRKSFDSIKSKVKLNTWIASTALSLVIGAIFGSIFI